jgi:hypothetical protein
MNYNNKFSPTTNALIQTFLSNLPYEQRNKIKRYVNEHGCLPPAPKDGEEAPKSGKRVSKEIIKHSNNYGRRSLASILDITDNYKTIEYLPRMTSKYYLFKKKRISMPKRKNI